MNIDFDGLTLLRSPTDWAEYKHRCFGYILERRRQRGEDPTGGDAPKSYPCLAYYTTHAQDGYDFDESPLHVVCLFVYREDAEGLLEACRSASPTGAEG